MKGTFHSCDNDDFINIRRVIMNPNYIIEYGNKYGKEAAYKLYDLVMLCIEDCKDSN